MYEHTGQNIQNTALNQKSKSEGKKALTRDLIILVGVF